MGRWEARKVAWQAFGRLAARSTHAVRPTGRRQVPLLGQSRDPPPIPTGRTTQWPRVCMVCRVYMPFRRRLRQTKTWNRYQTYILYRPTVTHGTLALNSTQRWAQNPTVYSDKHNDKPTETQKRIEKRGREIIVHRRRTREQSRGIANAEKCI